VAAPTSLCDSGRRGAPWKVVSGGGVVRVVEGAGEEAVSVADVQLSRVLKPHMEVGKV
jgi:hypothetical protein